MTGKAAHIHAAASGRGARRYLPSMTPEERKDISNAIWLCAHHADLIDRDEVTYTADILRAMKNEHEAGCSARLRHMPIAGDEASGFIAIGPKIICLGILLSLDKDAWTFHIRNFVEGDFHDLIAFIESFEQAPPMDRYILVNELGDGRILRVSPSVAKAPEGGYSLRCAVFGAAARIPATQIPASLALTESHDLMTVSGNIATISGLNALPQHLKSCFSFQRGESPAYPQQGTRFAEFFSLLKGSAWLDQRLKLEVIRQAAIPYSDTFGSNELTPLQCIERVLSIEVCGEVPQDDWLPISFDLEVKGVGRWRHDVSIYIPFIVPSLPV